MSFPFSKQLALGLGAGVIVISALIIVWFSIPRPVPNPAHFVPAAQTIGFFTDVTKETIAPFLRSFPLLVSVPVSTTPSAIAILKTGTGKVGWALLEPQTGKAEPFRVQTSDASATALLQTVTEPLSRNYSYTVLQPDMATSLSAYLRFPDLQIDSSTPLASLLHTDSPVSLSTVSDGWQMRFLENIDVHFPVLSNGPKDVFAHPLLILHASDGKGLMDLLSSVLTPAPRLVIQTVLSQAITGLLGTDISPAYDLPILLHGTTTLQTATDPTGKLRIVLEGQIGNSSALIERLSTLFKAHLATITEDTDTFDGKFTMRTVRQDQSLIQEKTDAINGWSTQTISQTKTGDALWVATNGDHYVLSNDEAAFQKTLSQEAPALSTFDQTPAALGIIDSTGWNTFLAQKIPTIWPHVSLPSGTGGYLKWKMTQEGTRITLLFKKI